MSKSGAALEARDARERLSDLRQALNRDDPHYRYDFAVTGRPPIPVQLPQLVASVTEELPGGYVTFHVYAKFPDAVWDRPIPVSFNITRAELTPEQLEEFNNMVQYGTAMSLPESVISDINIDLPGGLGLVHGSGSVSLGPAHAPTDRPQRVAWATVPPHSIEPLAQLVFETEAPTRGMSGGGQLCGTDTTGIVAATMRFEPLDGGSRKVTISVKIIDPVGKPVRQVLPGVRFLHQFNAPNRLALGPEYGLLTVIDEFALPDFSQTIPATTVEFVEALVAISQRSGKDIAFPEADKLDEEDYANIINIGKLLRGELLPVTWTSTQVHIRADAVGSNFFSQGVVRTVQGLTFTFMGDSHDLGQFNTYLFAPRLDGDLNANPDHSWGLMAVAGDPAVPQV